MSTTPLPPDPTENSAAYYGAIIEHSPEAIVIADPHGHIKFANPSLTTLMGYTLAEVVGHSFLQFVYPADQPTIRKFFREQLQHPERVSAITYRLQHKDGSVRYVENVASVLPNGDVVGHNRDVTERERLAQNLRENAEHFRSLIEHASDGIGVIDALGLLSYVSPALERILGYRPAEMLGYPFIMFLHPQDFAISAEHFIQLRQMRGQVVTSENRFRHKNGTWRILEVALRLLPNNQVIANMRDITDRHSLTEALRAAADGTAAVVGEDFFRSLVKHLSLALGARHAYIVQYLPGPTPTAQMLAYWNGHEFAPNKTYSLTDTPCECVFTQHQTCWYQQVQADFPKDTDLAKDGINSYLGVPLFDSHGAAIGHLVVMDGGPLPAEAKEDPLLKIFASRAGAELERQQADVKLRSSETLFRSLVEISADGIVLVSPQGNFLYASPGYERLSGYTPAELIGQSIFNIVYPPDLPLITAIFRQLMEGQVPLAQMEYRHQHKSGALRIVQAIGKTLPNGEIVGFTRDITEQKQAEAQLRASEEQFRSLIENAADSIAVLDVNGRYIHLSPSTERILGITTASLLGQPFLTLLHPEDMAGLERNFRWLLTHPGEVLAVEGRFRHATGEWRVLENVVRYVPSMGVIVNSRDISERRALENDLRHLNEELEARVEQRTQEVRRLATIIETTTDYVGIANLEGHSLYVNRTGWRMVGKPEADYGQTFKVMDCHPPTEHPKLQEMFAAALRGETWQGETLLLHTAGHTIPVSMVAVALANAQGQVEAVAAIMRDITEQKRSEAELTAAKDTAEQANRAKSTFLANMSHEIRTPLNAVIGMTGLLLHTALTEKQRDFAETIRTAGDALLSLINDILDFSKIEAGRLDLEQQPFDLRACVESALDIVAPRAAEKQIDLAYFFATAAPAGVVGDVTRLRQVLVNLVGNAVKFTHRGEVVVSVDVETPEKPEPQAPTAPQVTLHFSVRDTGVGIAPDKLPLLFQSFTQLDASTTRQFGGTGLGLAISKRLLALMGGKIWAESPGLEQGTTFHIRVTLPTTPLPVRQHLQQPRAELQGKRVLIVDDNATNRRILSLQLQGWGLLALEAPTPHAALVTLAQNAQFDVALLDMHMPEMDGVTLATAIRELAQHQPTLRQLPLIMLTSLHSAEVEQAAQFAAFLTKPVKASQLYDVLVNVLVAGPTPITPAASPSHQPLAHQVPLRLLLVEDVVVNQKFALLALAEMGYTADLAANGLEALQAVMRQPYDVVLMDVQMPEMDGLEATRQILQLWAEKAAQLPTPTRPRIIAMTANALQGDREMCLAAGMDDYLSKPIYLDELRAALTRAGAGRVSGKVRPAPPAPPPEGGPLLDQASLAKVLKRTNGAQIVSLYLEESQQQFEQLQAAFAQPAAKAVREAAHSLKGSSSYLGATRVMTLCARLEQLAKANELNAEATALLSELTTALAQTRQALTTAIGASN